MRSLRQFFVSLQGSEFRQLYFWVGSLVSLLLLFIVAQQTEAERGSYALMAGLFLINSAVFFSLFRHYPKLGVVMLIFTYMIHLASLGLLIFSAASFIG